MQFEWSSAVLGVLYQIAEFLLVTVLFKYIILRWIAEKLGKFLKSQLVRTRVHVVYWIHYREKALGHGHQYASPEVCRDGVCKTMHED